MYAVGADHPLKQPCLSVLEAVATDKLSGTTDVEVLQEILYRYAAQGQRGRAVDVVRLFLRVVPDARPVTKECFLLAIDLFDRHPALQPRDALHAAVMQRNGIHQIISADRHFDGIPGITRVDPAEWHTGDRPPR
jgi:predicted nucleic acid-binding protein